MRPKPANSSPHKVRWKQHDDCQSFAVTQAGSSPTRAPPYGFHLFQGTRSQLAVLRDERDRLKREISNLAGVIAVGRHSPALLAKLEKREKRLDEISDELLATDGRGIDARLREVEEFVLGRVQELSTLLAAEILRAKAELARHCTEITVTPDGRTYTLSGEWDLIGVFSDGAGGQNRTGYARLFRAALYH